MPARGFVGFVASRAAPLQAVSPLSPLVRAAYGHKYGRLVELKRVYDPDNVLRANQNIPPNG